MQRLLIPALAGLIACSPIHKGDKVSLPAGPLPVDAGMESDLAGQVDAAVLAYLEESGAPGMSIGLIKDGQPVYTAGYGWADIENERAFLATTPVLLSSVSKTFVGVAAQQAFERDQLSMDTPASACVAFAVDNPRVDGDTITLGHLLTHNSGIRDSWMFNGLEYAEGDPTISLADFERDYLVEDGAHYRKSNFAREQPGTQFAYSNVGMALAGLCLGESQQLEFSELVRRDILAPLGMDDSAYLLANLTLEPAVPYARAGDQYRAYAQYGYPTYPDGMMRSSAVEMARYLAAIENGGELDGTRILSAASVDAMLTIDESWGTDESGQAVAWAMREADGRQLFGHNGGDFGSSTEVWIDREAGTGIAILMHSNPPSFSEWFALELALLDLLD